MYRQQARGGGGGRGRSQAGHLLLDRPCPSDEKKPIGGNPHSRVDLNVKCSKSAGWRSFGTASVRLAWSGTGRGWWAWMGCSGGCRSRAGRLSRTKLARFRCVMYDDGAEEREGSSCVVLARPDGRVVGWSLVWGSFVFCVISTVFVRRPGLSVRFSASFHAVHLTPYSLFLLCVSFGSLIRFKRHLFAIIFQFFGHASSIHFLFSTVNSIFR